MADELKQISLVVDTDRNSAKDFSGNLIGIPQIVNGDTVLFAGQFQRLNADTGELEDLDLTEGGAPQALRFTCRSIRSSASALLTFQDAWNQGDLPAFEDATTGRITWKVNYNSANLDALFAAGAEAVTVWFELVWLSAGGVPQTLYQAQHTVVQQVDDGATGEPPPNSPTYLTAAEIALLYPGWDDLGYWDDVIDKDLTAPPGGESVDDRYIVGAAATGDWSGRVGSLAIKTISAWNFYPPAEGYTAWLNDEDTKYVYFGGVWIAQHALPAGTVEGQMSYWKQSAKLFALAKSTGMTWDEIKQLLNVNAIQFSLTPTDTPAGEGIMVWNADDGVPEIGMPGGNVTLQIGQELMAPRAKAIGSNISNGDLVYVSGASGDNPHMTLASAATLAQAVGTIAMATEDIAENALGYFTTDGLVRDLVTNGDAAGTLVYLSATTPGGWTSTEPTNPNYSVCVGTVIRSHATEGSIYVHIQENSWKTIAERTYQPLFNGLYTPTALGLTYDPATRTLAVVNSGTDVVVGGVVATPEDETTAAHDDATGAYYFYYESGATTLTVSTSPWDIMIHAPAAFVYFNTDMGVDAGVHIEERHSIQWDAEHHLTEHFFHGTKFISGMEISDYVLQSAVEADIQYSVAAGTIADEDIVEAITTLAAAGPYTIFSRAGADAANRWDWDETPTAPLLDGGSYLYWNELTGGTWQHTPAATNNYVNMYVVSIPIVGGGDRTIQVMGQAVYSTLAGAQNEGFSSISWGTAPSQEMSPLYRVTFRTSAAYVTSGKCRIEAIEDLRGSTGGTAAILGTPTAHNGLSGRDQAGAHPDTAVTVDPSGFSDNFGAGNTDVHLGLLRLDAMTVLGIHKASVDAAESVIVDAGHELLNHGQYIVDGDLTVDGDFIEVL